jgi:tetratricopeptide (TPR) repeat protein
MYHYNKGLVKSRLDDVDAAIKSYKDALDNLDPQGQQDYVYQAKFNRGICYRRKGMLTESIEDLKQATIMKAEKASAHNNLALSYFESEYFDEALTHYTKAIQIEPSAVHYNNRGLANYHFDQFEEAKQDFDEALKKDGNDATIYFNRGNVYLNWKPTQMYDKAHEDYDQAL